LEIAKRSVNSFTFPDARSDIIIAAALRSTPSCTTNLLKLSRCGVLPRLLSGFDLRHSSTSGFNWCPAHAVKMAILSSSVTLTVVLPEVRIGRLAGGALTGVLRPSLSPA
jgi:hypothetical protein